VAPWRVGRVCLLKLPPTAFLVGVFSLHGGVLWSGERSSQTRMDVAALATHYGQCLGLADCPKRRRYLILLVTLPEPSGLLEKPLFEDL
jgi:hypothetical protein